MELSLFDKSLLNFLQGNLPICKRPFKAIAEALSVDEQTVLEHISMLKDAGYIRRIGTFFDSAELGYHGILVAVRVNRDSLENVAGIINEISGATHNYEREGEYNLWFTLLTRTQEEEDEIIRRVENLSGVEKIMRLKSRKKYKVNVQFQLK